MLGKALAVQLCPDLHFVRSRTQAIESSQAAADWIKSPQPPMQAHQPMHASRPLPECAYIQAHHTSRAVPAMRSLQGQCSTSRQLTVVAAKKGAASGKGKSALAGLLQKKEKAHKIERGEAVEGQRATPAQYASPEVSSAPPWERDQWPVDEDRRSRSVWRPIHRVTIGWSNEVADAV